VEVVRHAVTARQIKVNKAEFINFILKVTNSCKIKVIPRVKQLGDDAEPIHGIQLVLRVGGVAVSSCTVLHQVIKPGNEFSCIIILQGDIS